MNKQELLKDIATNPENHRHDFDGLTNCCLLDGVFHPELLAAHEKLELFVRNGGIICDVSGGPCSCGAWH